MLLIFLMISVGATTRLTRSGLSITEWNPIVGTMPPISEADWQREFDLYKQTPEYQKFNYHFELSDYKKIYFWEYVHRLLGRLIFFFILVPGIFFVRKKVFLSSQLVGLLALIAVQGLFGWLMVKSGLKDMPAVSPYWLSIHFFTALITLNIVFLMYKKIQLTHFTKRFFKKDYWLIALVFIFYLQVFYGCLMGGTRAGFAVFTWPTINGLWIPGSFFHFHESINMWISNMLNIQFVHRWLPLILIALGAHLAIKKNFGYGFLALILGQFVLGVFTLMFKVPISAGVLHQAYAVVISLYLTHRIAKNTV